MARWRTRAALAAVALVAVPAAIAAVVIQSSGFETHSQKTSVRPRLVPFGQGPLRVKGTGFVPGERVLVVLSGQTHKRRTVVAGPRGAFKLLFRMVSTCDSVTVSARGSKGSRASFNLSSYRCAAP